jgi:NADP-dependent 3-hydroxy acid dehydrogenase YdfG
VVVEVLTIDVEAAGVGELLRIVVGARQAQPDVMETNLGGVWRTAKAVIPAMIDCGGRSIVMI